MKNKFLVLLIVTMQATFANNLVISNVTKTDDSHLTFDISWDNMWNLNGYSDAVWVFGKYKDTSGNWYPLIITYTEPVSSTYNGYATNSPNGVIIFGDNSNSGVTMKYKITFDNSNTGPTPDFKIFGIEMVKINHGDFYVGDGVTGNIHQGDDATKPYHVLNDGIQTNGNSSTDFNLFYMSQNIPESYPVGFKGFIVMKYEITQEQYVEFLNTLTFQQQQTRTEKDLDNLGSGTHHYVMNNVQNYFPYYRNGIATDTAGAGEKHTFYCDLNNNGIPNEADDGQNVACVALSVNDNLAFLDWAGLRPMTVMEFEKVCRGNAYPVAGETALGTNLTPNSVTASHVTNLGANNEMTTDVANSGGIVNYNGFGSVLRVGCFAKANTNRLQSGAGFYGVMNLQGNLREWCVDITETSFTDAVGDGKLEPSGNSSLWINMHLVEKANAFGDTTIRPISDLAYFIGLGSGNLSELDARDKHGTVRGVFNLTY